MPKTKLRMIQNNIKGDDMLSKMANEMFFSIRFQEYSDELKRAISDDINLLELLNSEKSEFVFNIEFKHSFESPILIKSLADWILENDKNTRNFGIVKSNIKTIKFRVFGPNKPVNLHLDNVENLSLARRAFIVLKTPESVELDFEDLIKREIESSNKVESTRFEAREVFSFNSVIKMIPKITKLVTNNYMLISKNDLIKGYEITTDSEKQSELIPTVIQGGMRISKIPKNINKRIVIVCDFIV